MKNITLSKTTIKYIAMIYMVLGHYFVYYQSQWWVTDYIYGIGQFVTPVFLIFTLDAYKYTKNKISYIYRLFIFSLISQMAFLLLGSARLEVPFCLLFSFLFYCLLKTNINKIIKSIISISVILISLYFLNYTASLGTFLFITFLYYVFTSKYIFSIAYLFGMFFIRLVECCLYIADKNSIKDFVYSAIDINIFDFWNVVKLDFIGYGIFIILFLLNDNKINTKYPMFNKWIFYIIYPLHIILLYLMQFI